MFRPWPIAVASIVVLSACSQPSNAPAGGQQTPATEPEVIEIPEPSTPPPPPPPPAEKSVDAEAPSEVTITEQEVKKESAFDSNQWNSAVGLGGGAATGYGRGRVGGRGASAES